MDCGVSAAALASSLSLGSSVLQAITLAKLPNLLCPNFSSAKERKKNISELMGKDERTQSRNIEPLVLSLHLYY